jgi:antitoxin HicB
MLQYPVTLERDDNDTIRVSFPDFPEAHTFGADRTEARERARDALTTVLDAYIRDRQRIPPPSRRSGLPVVDVPALTAAKVAIYQAMRASNVGKAELARRLGWHPPQVDRLLDVRHGSRLDQLEAASRALGRRLHVLVVEDSAELMIAIAHAIPGRRPSRAGRASRRTAQGRRKK